MEDAAALEVKVSEHRRQLSEYKKLREEDDRRKRLDPTNIDFSNPTPEQIEDASQHGIDLLDPMVISELQRLQASPISRLWEPLCIGRYKRPEQWEPDDEDEPQEEAAPANWLSYAPY
ncbi:MAG: hypothetical protein SGPRY_010880, partial [Prymnesium sp.]